MPWKVLLSQISHYSTEITGYMVAGISATVLLVTEELKITDAQELNLLLQNILLVCTILSTIATTIFMTYRIIKLKNDKEH